MEGQEPSANQPDAQVAESTNQGSGEDVAALKAQLADARAALDKTRDEAAKRRVQKREAEEAQARALAEQQEYKAAFEQASGALEQYKAQVAELEALKEKASAYDAHLSKVAESVEADMAGLSDEQRALVELAPDPLSRRRAIDLLKSTANTGAAKPFPAASASAASGAPPDFDSLARTNPEAFRAARTQHPEAHKAWLTGAGGGQRMTTIDRIMGRGKR